MFTMRVPFADTDAMGVVHHSNYLRYFEMARVDFLRKHGLNYSNYSSRGWHFPLVEAGCRYRRPFKFDDPIKIIIQTHLERARFVFKYQVRHGETGELHTTGFTHHVCVDNNFKRVDPPKELISILEKEHQHG